jgi:hypothetical protein
MPLCSRRAWKTLQGPVDPSRFTTCPHGPLRSGGGASAPTPRAPHPVPTGPPGKRFLKTDQALFSVTQNLQSGPSVHSLKAAVLIDIQRQFSLTLNSRGLVQHCGPAWGIFGSRLCTSGQSDQSFRDCGIGCEDTGEVPSRPGLTQELTGFVPCQRFVVWSWTGFLMQPTDDVVT